MRRKRNAWWLGLFTFLHLFSTHASIWRKVTWLVSRLPYLYLLRVPLLAGAFLLLLPPIALLTGANPLLANLFDLDESGVVGVTIVSLTASWTVMVTSWMIVLYGSRRFKVPRIHISFPPRRLHVALFGMLALPVALASIYWSVSQSRKTVGSLLFSELLGLGVTLFMLWRMLLLVNLLSGVADWLTVLSRLGAGYTVSPHNAPKQLALEWRSIPLNKFGQPIYRDPAKLPGWKTGRVLLPGHALALASALGFSILYLVIGIGKWVNIGNPPTIPTLGFVLLLSSTACFALTGMTFFFDRYRIPVVLPLLVLFAVTSRFPQSDHYFPVVQRDVGQAVALSPAEALRAGGHRNVIVVAANGGGIQSAAWTAQVLTGLEQKCRDEAAHGCRSFAASVRFISSVSGGSVGTMYFVNGFDKTTHALPDDLAPIRERSQQSSLDDVAWGLCYPDLFRLVLPWFWKGVDRGMALENALTREPSLAEPLSAWRQGVREGWRPATVFNATVVETGERLHLSTTDLPSLTGKGDLYRQHLGVGNDIKIVTAARLSASFPFVTPAARANLPGPRFHIVDGGYYDNYGIASLVEWLDQALSAPDNPIENVMVVEILGAPSDTQAQPQSQGWLYQGWAPIEAMLNVRTAAQFAHNQEESDLLTRLWKNREGRRVNISHVTFQFCDANPPLSWHLSEKQKAAIAGAWDKELKQGKHWQRVVGFLRGEPAIAEESDQSCL